MNYTGVVIGIIAFAVIGIFHPIVIKCEYHFGAKVWPIFLVSGLVLLIASLFIGNTILSSGIGVIGFTCLWSVLELKEQAQRVARGWFPANPKFQKPPSKDESPLS